MNVDDAVRAAYDALVDRPADLLPLYFVGAGTVQVARVSLLAAGAAAYLLLARDGGLAAFRDALAGRELHPDATAPGNVVEGLSAEQLADLATTHLVAPDAVAVLGAGLLGLLVLQLAATAVANAGKLHAVRVCLAGEDGAVRAGAAGLRDDGPTLVVVAALRVAAVVVVVAAVQVAGLAGGPAVGALAALVALVPLAGIYLAFMFAPQAVVVDGVGPVAAARASLRFVADEPATTLLYGVVAAGVVGVVGAAAGLFVALSVSQLVGPVVWFLALPVLDLVKTGIYLDNDGAGVEDAEVGAVEREAVAADSVEDAAGDGSQWPGPDAGERGVPLADGEADAGASVADATVVVPDGGADPSNGDVDSTDSPDALARLRVALGRGVGELGAFVRDAPALVAVAAALFALGGVAGWRVTAPFEFVVVRTGPVAATFGSFPVDVFVALAVNNWSVAATTSFAGLAAGVPTVAALLFNGVVVGAVAGLGYDPLLLTALVAPHGVVEFPALAVSGALGLHLGGEGWRFARGRRSADELAGVLRRAFRVLVGLAPVFVVAAFVEAFLTPAIASLVAG